MSVIIKIGNLQIIDIEKELGIVFSDEDRDYLASTHQENISKELQPNNWHFYDLPRMIEFGSYKAFDKFKKMLKEYKTDKPIKTCFYNEDTRLEAIFEMTDSKSGLPKYLVRTTYQERFLFIDRNLLVLKKVNKKTAIYEVVKPSSLERLYEDKLGYEGISIFSDPYVPKDRVETYGEIKLNIDDIQNLDKNGNILVTSEKTYGYTKKKDEKKYSSYKVWDNSSTWTVSARKSSVSKFERMLEDNKKHLLSKKNEG